MTSPPHSAADIEREALRLTEKQRARIALRLLSSLEPTEGSPSEIEAAWLEEVERRDREIEDGTVTTIPAEKVFAALRRKRRP